ncbi:energy transducer TonB [Flavicella sediminum]|uniref:energy transducer TonB n=1 Tax=Flavicella sediminum TaxID=2585141 RepID=UPI00111E4E14|nr:energy transducer TonB [Flavicella sediminum]
MEKNTKLRINNPCSETWGVMKLGINSRHCSSCNKSVVDFTKKSKKEIFEILDKKQAGSICGRVCSNQLDFELTPEEIILNYNRGTANLFQNTPLYICTIAATLVLSSCYDSDSAYFENGVEALISPHQDSIPDLDKIECETTDDIIDEEMLTITMGVIVTDTDFKEPYHYVDKQPEFIGGRQKLKSYLEKNISAHKQKGTSHCYFVVDKTGRIKNLKLSGKLDASISKEISKAFENMPNWKPAEKNGKIVEAFYSLPIKFE